MLEPRPWKDGRKFIFRACPWNADHDDDDAFIVEHGNGAVAAGCQHNGCAGKGWRDLRVLYEPDAYSRLRAVAGSDPGPLESNAGGGASTDPDPGGDVARELHLLRTRDRARRLFAAEQRSAGSEPPEMLTLAARLERPLPATQYRIRDWQPAGSRVMFVAQYKAGKTTALGNLLRCLVDGAHWLGVAEVKRLTGTAVLFDTEMSPRQLDEWLGDQRIIHPEQLVVIPLRGRLGSFNILDETVRTEWAAKLRDVGAEYVALDCLRPLMDSLGLDENHEAGRVLVAFDALLEAAGVADACVVHHMGHSSERSRGDSRLRDWPDVEWRLLRENDEPSSARFITAFGRDVDIHEKALHYDSLSRHLTLAGGSRRDAAQQAALEAVHALLHEASEPLSGRAVESAMRDLGLHRADVRGALKLGREGKNLTTRAGSRGSILYECASAPECAVSAPAQVSECASAPIGRRTHDALSEEPVRRAEDLAGTAAAKEERWS